MCMSVLVVHFYNDSNLGTSHCPKLVRSNFKNRSVAKLVIKAKIG